MKDKKLNLGKITITKLNNLHHIRGGHIIFTGTVMETQQGDTCPTETETNPDNVDITEICQQ